MTREEAITKLVAYAFWASEHVPDEVAQALDIAIEALKEQRPHGEWENGVCTNCGAECFEDYYMRDIKTEFCHRCGADMRGGGKK